MAFVFPEAKVVHDLLSSLLGNAGEVNGEGTPAAPEQSFAAVMIDDGDQPVGAIIADVRAAAMLAGSLLMMPVDGLIERAGEGDFPTAALDALSEVFNNLTICINDTKGNPHVRALPAASTTAVAADQDWLAGATERVDLEATFAGKAGTLSFIAK